MLLLNGCCSWLLLYTVRMRISSQLLAVVLFLQTGMNLRSLNTVHDSQSKQPQNGHESSQKF
jgi:hypothetical protein